MKQIFEHKLSLRQQKPICRPVELRDVFGGEYNDIMVNREGYRN